MSYAGDEDAPGLLANDIQLVLESVDVALQFVTRHAVGRDMGLLWGFSIGTSSGFVVI
jgi:tetrahydromethanopterin S-methyltransferase subunit G